MFCIIFCFLERLSGGVVGVMSHDECRRESIIWQRLARYTSVWAFSFVGYLVMAQRNSRNCVSRERWNVHVSGEGIWASDVSPSWRAFVFDNYLRIQIYGRPWGRCWELSRLHDIYWLSIATNEAVWRISHSRNQSESLIWALTYMLLTCLNSDNCSVAYCWSWLQQVLGLPAKWDFVGVVGKNVLHRGWIAVAILFLLSFPFLDDHYAIFFVLFQNRVVRGSQRNFVIRSRSVRHWTTQIRSWAVNRWFAAAGQR